MDIGTFIRLSIRVSLRENDGWAIVLCGIGGPRKAQFDRGSPCWRFAALAEPGKAQCAAAQDVVL